MTVGAGGESLQQEVIQPSLIQALMAWHASGADARELRQLAGVSVTISDLPGNVLARTAGRTIVLDHDAAGNGWFVDPSPWDHVEFGGTRAAGWTQGAGYATSRVAADRIDLLTTLTHEFGHLLGMDDLRQVNHVMNHELEVGRRVLPEASQTDAHGFDINRDDRVSSLDALVVINQLSTQSVLKADGRFWHGHQDLNWLPFDTNLDGYLSTIDVLGVLNHLSSIQASEGEAEQLQNGFSVGYECTPAIDVDFVHAEITRDGVVQTLRLDTGIDVAPAPSDGLGFRFNAWKQPGSYRAGSAPQRSQGVERGALVTGSGIASLTDVDLSMAQGMTPDEIIQARLA